jgi:hypothetical protein
MRVLVLVGLAWPAAAQINFDNVPQGTIPPHWTRPQGDSRLLVQRDPTAPSRPNVFGQTGSGGHEAGFPLLYNSVTCRDGDVSVKFKIAPGKPDQTAGLMFRYQDPNNYYLLNFSVDRQRIWLVRVLNGERSILLGSGQRDGSGLPHDLKAGQWYVAKVSFRGPKVRVLFGNRKLFEIDDPQFQRAGMTGVWTRGQTQASFDDFKVDKKG